MTFDAILTMKLRGEFLPEQVAFKRFNFKWLE